MWTDAELTQRLVDRQFELVLSAAGQRRLRLLPRLLEFLEREPLTSAVLRDLSADADRALATYANACAEARAQLQAIWKRHGKWITESLDVGGRQPYDDDHCAPEEYGEQLSHPPNVQTLSTLRVGIQGIDDTTLSQALALRQWSRSVRQRVGSTPKLTRIANNAQRILQDTEHALRAVTLAALGDGGFCLIRLRQIASRIHPESDDVVTLAIHEDYRREVFGRNHPETPSQILSEDVHNVAECASILRDEIHQRLIVGLSRWSVVARFAARAETFHRQRLVKESKGRTAERVLTLEFASYLFDAGFTPILDPNIAGLKPDVISMSSSSLFYVEAKQYKSRSPGAQIRKAYQQVWSTWMRLEKQHTIREGFLVVFRRGGPLVDLPARLILGERRLYSTLIDLSANAGSKEQHQPITIDESELLPRKKVGREPTRRRPTSA